MAIPETPGTPATPQASDDDLPTIGESEPFAAVVDKTSASISRTIDSAYTYEQLRTSVGAQKLKPLICSLTEDCHHTSIVAALLASRWLFISIESDGTGLNESRAHACEIVAGQFLSYLSEKELIDYLLFELPTSDSRPTFSASGGRTEHVHEGTALLQAPERDLLSTSSAARTDASLAKIRNASDGNIGDSFQGLNALEIAAVANAKKFLSQTQVQKIVTGIWDGDIIFWDSLSIHSVKKAQMQTRRVTDPYTRLRVPKYQKTFQVAFFASFLALYYAVLIERNPHHVTAQEILLYASPLHSKPVLVKPRKHSRISCSPRMRPFSPSDISLKATTDQHPAHFSNTC